MRRRVLSVVLLSGIIGLVCLCTNRTPTSAGTAEFRITNLVFCSTKPEDYMKYKEQANATYKPGDVVWIYMNLNNVKYKQNADSSYEIFIPEHLLVKDPRGEILLDGDLLTAPITFSKERDMNQVFLTNNINTTESLEDGEYEVNITITDRMTGKVAKAVARFKLKR